MNPFVRIKVFFKYTARPRFLTCIRREPELTDEDYAHRDGMPSLFDQFAAAAEARDKLPVIFGDYDLDLDARLGSGAFGTVHICEHRVTKKIYAGKLFNIGFVTEPGNIDMIYSEVDILKRISHKNTVSFVDLVFSRRGALLVMELVEGKDLHDMVPRNIGMLESFARVLFVQLLDAMEYLHSQRIVHRDIKIENVLIDTHGNLKLVDYGLADLVSEDAFAKKGLIVSGAYGTRYCYAPEIVRALEDDDEEVEFRGDKADIWAAGIFLYSLVSGNNPFSDDSEEELMREISLVNVDYDTVGFSPELEHLLRSILKLDPSDRASIEEMRGHPWSQGKQFDDTTKTEFSSPDCKLHISFANGTLEKTLSCPKRFLQPETAPHSSPRKTASCREFCGWRSEGCSDPASDNSVKSYAPSDDGDSSSALDLYDSNEDDETMTSQCEKSRSWGDGRALRRRYSALKSGLRNLNDRLRGRVVRSELTRYDMEQRW